MRTNIKGTNIELTPAISAYVEKKLGAVSKFLGSNVDAVAHVEVGKITHHHKSGEVFRAEVHLVGGGVDAYAASEQEDLYAAIDLVKDEILSELNRKKGKRESLTRRGGRFAKSVIKGLNPFRKRD